MNEITEELKLYIQTQTKYLKTIQNPKEGWGIEYRSKSSPLNTAEAVAAFLQSDSDQINSNIDEAVQYLLRTQRRDKGWASRIISVQKDEPSQTNATSWAAQVLFEYGTTESLAAAISAYKFLFDRCRDGWVEYLNGKPSVTATCYTLLALLKIHNLDDKLKSINLDDELKSINQKCISDGLNWLASIRNPDGSFGFYLGDQKRYSASVLVSLVAILAKGKGFQIGAFNKTIQWVIDGLKNSDKRFIEGDIEAVECKTMGTQYEHFTLAILVRFLYTEGTEINDALRQTYIEHLCELQQPGGGCSITRHSRIFTYTTAHMIIALAAAHDWQKKCAMKVTHLKTATPPTISVEKRAEDAKEILIKAKYDPRFTDIKENIEQILPLLETQLEVFRKAKEKAEILQDSSSKGDHTNAMLGLNNLLTKKEKLLSYIKHELKGGNV